MSRQALLLLVCTLALGGCASVTRPAAYPQRYTLAAPPPATRATSQPAHDATLEVARVSVPAWLAGDGLYYRLDYGNRRRVAAYADSAWAAPPADMLQQLVRNTLAGAGGWRAVVGPGSNAQAQVTLQVDVEDFSQVFTTPQASFGVLDATATLVDAASTRVTAQRSFHLRVAAPTPDAAGGVAALGTASRDFARQLQAWLRTQVLQP